MNNQISFDPVKFTNEVPTNIEITNKKQRLKSANIKFGLSAGNQRRQVAKLVTKQFQLEEIRQNQYQTCQFLDEHTIQGSLTGYLRKKSTETFNKRHNQMKQVQESVLKQKDQFNFENNIELIQNNNQFKLGFDQKNYQDDKRIFSATDRDIKRRIVSATHAKTLRTGVSVKFNQNQPMFDFQQQNQLQLAIQQNRINQKQDQQHKIPQTITSKSSIEGKSQNSILKGKFSKINGNQEYSQINSDKNTSDEVVKKAIQSASNPTRDTKLQKMQGKSINIFDPSQISFLDDQSQLTTEIRKDQNKNLQMHSPFDFTQNSIQSATQENKPKYQQQDIQKQMLIKENTQQSYFAKSKNNSPQNKKQNNSPQRKQFLTPIMQLVQIQSQVLDNDSVQESPFKIISDSKINPNKRDYSPIQLQENP